MTQEMTRGRPVGSRSKGYSVSRLPSGRWRCRTRTPVGEVISATRESEAEAMRWGQEQVERIQAGRRVDRMMRTPTIDLAKRYLADLEARGRSAKHLADTGRILERYAVAVPQLAAADADGATSIWLDDAARGLSPRTRNTYLVVIRGLCRWCLRRRLIGEDPTQHIERASEPDRLKPQFTMHELRNITTAVDDPWHLPWCLLIYTGCRVEEALSLRWQDIDAAGAVIAITMEGGRRVKRNRERLVPLQPELAWWLDWHRPGWRSLRDGAVVTGGDSNRRRSMQAMLRRLGIDPRGRTPHSCRHTYAGIMTATGVPGPLLMAYLGHSSAATTIGYTRLAARYVSAVEDWPRGRMRLLPGAECQWSPEPPPADPDELLSLREVRSLARCRHAVVVDAARTGELPVHSRGPRNAARIRRIDAETWAAKRLSQ